jgi:nickel/cobalt exporter
MRIIITALFLSLALTLTFAGAGQSLAQSQPTPFGVRAPVAAAQPPSATPGEAPGPWRAFWIWAETTQQQLHRSIGKLTAALGRDGSFNAGVMLIALSFVYGVLHALGPGHGKAAIGSYVLASRQTLRRGVALSFASAFAQGLTATAIAGVLVLAVHATSMEIQSTVGNLESASYALIAFTGCWLLYLAVSRIWSARRAPAAVHGGVHDHECQHGREGGACACGHAHIPDASVVKGDFSLWRAAAIVLAVGIRPCTGALIALIVALQQSIFFAGVLAVFANSIGTAITVSLLVTITVSSRNVAAAAAGGRSAWATRVYDFAAIGGALFLVAMGVTLFVASLGPARPFL